VYLSLVVKEKTMAVVRWLIVWLYLIAGVLHILLPAPFLKITPFWVPMPALVIWLTGVCEIAGAAGLLIPRLRKSAGLGLALYAVAVFPANINHALQDLSGSHMGLSLWYHLPRLAFQPVLVWAALFAGQVITWPFRPRTYHQL
jgi:uncharacterized membrane protein